MSGLGDWLTYPRAAALCRGETALVCGHPPKGGFGTPWHCPMPTPGCSVPPYTRSCDTGRRRGHPELPLHPVVRWPPVHLSPQHLCAVVLRPLSPGHPPLPKSTPSIHPPTSKQPLSHLPLLLTPFFLPPNTHPSIHSSPAPTQSPIHPSPPKIHPSIHPSIP